MCLYRWDVIRATYSKSELIYSPTPIPKPAPPAIWRIYHPSLKSPESDLGVIPDLGDVGIPHSSFLIIYSIHTALNSLFISLSINLCSEQAKEEQVLIINISIEYL